MRSFGHFVKIFLFIGRVYLLVSFEGLPLGLEEILAVGLEMGERASVAEAFEWPACWYFLLLNTLQVHYIINV